MISYCERNHRAMTSNLLLKSGILIVIGLIFFPETAGANSSEDNDLVKTQRCISWTSNEYIRQTIEAARKLSQPCPCHKSIIETDLSYYKSGHCYIQRFFTDGGKQKCCYDKYGSLSLNYPDGGYLILEQSSTGVNDAFKDCCHGDKTTCELFYMVNPSDNCSAFTVDSRTTSWGDPQITTVDNHTYTFNGHGEYIYLDLNHGALTIEARTEYLQEGNIDSTIFTAFALTINDTERITLLLEHNKNKTASKVNAFSNHALIKGNGLVGRFQVIVLDKEIVITFRGVSHISQIKQVTVKASAGLSMSLDTTASIQQSVCVGLAGFTRNSSFINRTTEHGTNINASSSEIFDFGESWMLQNKSESVFDYTLTNKTFDYYNNNHTRPFFPEDYLNNLTAMFNVKFHHNKSDVERFKTLCEDYTPCLTEIARTDDSQLGKQILDEHKRMVSEEQRKRNKLPWFTDEMPTNISIISADLGGFSLNLTKYVKDDQDSPSKMSFSVDTNINTTDYSLKNGIFNWTNISLTLRSEDIYLTFIVKDKWNFTALAPVTVFFCGCRSASQCNFHVLQPKVLKGTTSFERTTCVCKDKFVDGDFCEIDKPPCSVINCDPRVKCDNTSTNKDNPCGACPDGYEGNGLNCKDINECAKDYCEQDCNNTEGSYSCGCQQGYTLSDNKHNCTDVDECKIKSDDCSLYKNTRCRNIPGSFVCDCKPKFHKARDGSGDCEQGGFSYVTHLTMDVTSIGLNYTTNHTYGQTESRQIQTQLTALFQGTKNFLSVEVISVHLIIIQTRRRKREAAHKRLDIDFIVITENQTTTDALSKDLIRTIKNKPQATFWSVPLADLNLDSGLKVIPEHENKLCEVTADTCDTESTNCKQRNGSTFCECKHPGFTAYDYEVNFCKDVDECTNSTYLGTNTSDDRCYQGTCHNTHGSWECVCPGDLIWKRTGEGFYRCMGDYQYVGNISYYAYSVNASKIRQGVGLELTEIFNTSTVNLTGNLTMNETFISVEVLDLKSHEVPQLGPGVFWVSIRYILHIGEPVAWDTVADIQNLSFTNRDWSNLKADYFKAYIYDEKEYSICDIPGKTDCDAVTTACMVTDGAYYCNCKEGYMKTGQVKRDNSNFCTDVDECALNNCSKPDANCCSKHGVCVNTIGNWTCNCQDGFEVNYNGYDNITCEDVDECAILGEDACGVNGKCVNLRPGWDCDCLTGFKNATVGSSHTCIDVDECKLYNCSTNGTCCSGHGKCSNTFGNWTCLCSPGYVTSYHSYSNISCDDINECEHNETYACRNGNCSNTDGSWDCSCGEGYRLQTISTDVHFCEDVDECSSASYQCLQGDCLNLPGSWSCVCPQGYRNTTASTEDDITTVRCNNINECSQASYGIPACLESAACVDTNGSWNCLCRTGLTSKPLNSTTKICGGDYQYVRVIEFTLVENSPNLETLKTEIEAMLLKMYLKGLQNHTHEIYVEVISINPVARARQKRQAPPSRDLKVEYIVHTDVKLNQTTVTNVLKEHLKACENSSCSEKDIGTYRINIRNTPSLLSHTIDLCELPSKDYCDHSSTNCSEKNNVIECICKDGYTVDTFSATSCKDKDECKQSSEYVCSGNTTGNNNGCRNIPGGWTCNCQEGFIPHRYGRFNVTCEDIDECNDDSGNYSCMDSVANSNAANCSNSIGSWSCTCAEGYRRRKLEKNKYVCEDINECQDQTGEYACGDASSSRNSGARCENTDGDWSCSCAVGYTRKTVVEGKKYNCEDLCDENPCQNNGNCLHGNNGENFTCVCSAGWTGILCDTKDPESTHLKTILIACGSAAAAVIVLLILAIFGIWRYRFSAREKKDVPERISLNTFGTRDSWPFRNGNLYTSPDKVSLNSDRDSRRLSIPRARIGNQVQDVYLEETIELRNPAPDYDLRHSSGVLNPAPDYGPEDSPVMRRKNSDPRDKRGNHNHPSNKKQQQEPAYNRNSVPAGLNDAYSYL